MPPQRKFTAVAEQAMDFATLFNVNFAAPVAGATTRYRLELTTPVGPSTSGGKQALQHIRLVPEDNGSAIVVGTSSQVDKAAEIRTLRHVAELHATRFRGAHFPIDQEHYQTLIRRLQQFFLAQGHTVVMLEVATPSLTPPPPAPGGVSSSVIAAVVVMSLLVAGLVGVLLTR